MKALFIYFFLLVSAACVGQDILKERLNKDSEGKSLISVFKELQQDHSVRFFFLEEWLTGFVCRGEHIGKTLDAVLDDLFRGSDLSYVTMYPNTVVIVRDPSSAIARRAALENAVRQKKVIEQFAFGQSGTSSKSKVRIYGVVKDAKTGEGLSEASIRISDSSYGTTTDNEGKFVLVVSPGNWVVDIGYVAFESKVIDLQAYADGEMMVSLEEVPILLDEVVIQNNASKELSTSRIGQSQLTIRDIKSAPAFLGEPDVIKQVQTLPGVTTVGEAAMGFNVRGSGVDQNLILYDGLPVFNSSHVFGFLSAFNSEGIRDVDFYRGGIPAEYGGRISSVLDMKARDGDLQRWNGNAGIGLITSNVMINGPLKKDKTSIAGSFRSTYSNYLLNFVDTDYGDLSNTSVKFYDATLKLSHLFAPQTKLSVTSYLSRDAFRLVGDSTYQWDNLQVSAKLDHTFSSGIGAEFIAGTTSYGYNVLNANPRTASDLSFRILSTVAKAGFNFQKGVHKLNFGLNFTHYAFDPGSVTPTTSESSTEAAAMQKQYSAETALYFADEWPAFDQITVEVGLRLPVFISFGPGTVFKYEGGHPTSVRDITDTLHYGGFQPMQTYLRAEPRLTLKWAVSQSSSIKLGYNRMYQFLNLITNSAAVTPIDIWQPSGYYFKPQRADQISLGYFLDGRQKRLSASLEGFYKLLDNILDFKDGAQLIMNNHLETELLQGKGRSYGIEFYLARNAGRLSGALNYTYSRSFRSVEGRVPGESVNAGKEYPSNFDQPHVANVSWRYNISRRYAFTGNFVYHTGRPITIPLSSFTWEDSQVAYFSGRNQYRIPDYHRLDVALVLEGNHRRDRRLKGTWVFSVYNVYGRKNPYSVFFKSSGAGVPQPYQLSIIGTMVPSVSYNLRFQ